LVPPSFGSLLEVSGNDRGVSPVIGTILLVAITVILASTSGTFVLGIIGDFTQDEPLASFQMSQNSTSVVFTHSGGESLDGENVYIQHESGGSFGNFAGTDGDACDATHARVNPGTKCKISDRPTGELVLVWHSAGQSEVLHEGQVFERGSSSTPTATPTPTPSSADGIEPVNAEGVDTQSSQIQLVFENSGSDSVTIVDFAVDATAISNDIWIDDGNNPEFETSGASDDGNANEPDRKENSFLADGTTYGLAANSGEDATLAATDDSVTVTFRAFGPDSEWIDDSDELQLVDDVSEADVIVYLGMDDGSTAELYLQVA
jgi:flagellin-like protein